MGRSEKPLSAVLSPLIFGTGVFNFQFHQTPSKLPILPLLHRALASKVTSAFDTSPYYGPSEALLGAALSHPSTRASFPRETYSILTKVGRVSANCFDYSPEWIRKSIQRSLKRLKTDYLDVVYCHDVEFVTPEEAVGAIRELRRLRDEEGSVKYVGVSGYPVDTLCEIAERILRETGEPLDIVQSYSNFTLQNTRLLSRGRERLKNAGVDVVPNASVISMGLLRHQGLPVGGMGDWHPAPQGLRVAVKEASEWLEQRGERLEVLATRFALDYWSREGADVGVSTLSGPGFDKLGPSVMGVSNLEELEVFIQVWNRVLEDHNLRSTTLDSGMISPESPESEVSTIPTRSHLQRRHKLDESVKGVQQILGNQWYDYTWSSPPPDYRREPHLSKDEEDQWAALSHQFAQSLPSTTYVEVGNGNEMDRHLNIKDDIEVTEVPLTPPSEADVKKA